MFEYFHQRRLAGVFFSTLMVLIGLLVLTGLASELEIKINWSQDWLIILPAIGLFLAVIVWYGVWRWKRRGRMGRYQSTPLSQDERIKARRKLAVKPNFKKR